MTDTTKKTTTTTTDKIDCTNIYLEKGSTGDKVKKVQTQLKALGFYVWSIDGSYGDHTVSAVRNAQSTMGGLKTDGIFGPATCKKWNTFYANKTNTSVDNTLDLSKIDCKTVSLKKGSKGSTVTLLQTALKKLNYYTGKIDGEYGALTADAVKKLQRETNHTDDGEFGPKTCPDFKTLCQKKGISKTSTSTQQASATAKAKQKEKVCNEVNTQLIDTFGTLDANIYIDGVGFICNSCSCSTPQSGKSWTTVEMMGDEVYTYQGHVQPLTYEVGVPLPWSTFMSIRKYLNQLCVESVPVTSSIVVSDNYFVSYTYKEGSKGNWLTVTFTLIQDL